MHKKNQKSYQASSGLGSEDVTRRDFLRRIAVCTAGAELVSVLPSRAQAGPNGEETGPPSNAPTGLLCDLLRHPVKTVVVDSVPEFSWVVSSTRRNDVQSAYRIIVGSADGNSEKNTGDMWDSGKIESSRSVNIPYDGKPLEPGARYYWKVMTWNRLGQPSGFSLPQTFVMYGRPDDYEPGPGMYQTPPDVLERTRFSVRTTSGDDKYLWKCRTSRYPLATEEVSPARLSKNEDDHYFADFGKDAFAYLRLTLNSPAAGREMKVIIGEHANERKVVGAPGCVVRIATTITLKQGTHTYKLPQKHGRRRMPPGVAVKPFRYVEIVDCPVELDKSMLTQVVYHYPFDDNASSFKSSDKTLTDVWSFCKYSMKATSFCGVYIDGERQRDTLHGDALVNQLGQYGVDREYTMARYSHEVLTMSRHWASEWMMCSPLMAWHDYMYTGNIESAAKYYDVLKLKTLHDLAREDGLIGPRLHPCFISSWAIGNDAKNIFGMSDKSARIAALKRMLSEAVPPQKHKRRVYELRMDWAARQLAAEKGRHKPGRLAHPERVAAWMGRRTLLDIIDHPASQQDHYDLIDVCTVPNAMHYGALFAMRDIARALDKPEEVRFFTQRTELVKSSINKKLFDHERRIYVDGEGSTHASIHANMFPLAFGLVPEAHKETVANYVKSRGMACSVYGAQYLLEGLYKAGESEHALNLMRSRDIRSWAHMIYDVGSTISMEAWDVRFKGNLDWNHPWGAVPANIIPRYLMGVRPLTAGFGRVLVQPSPGSLSSAEAIVPTIRGPIRIRFDNHRGKPFRMDLELPGNTTARVALPTGDGSSSVILCDGKSVNAKKERTSPRC